MGARTWASSCHSHGLASDRLYRRIPCRCGYHLSVRPDVVRATMDRAPCTGTNAGGNREPKPPLLPGGHPNRTGISTVQPEPDSVSDSLEFTCDSMCPGDPRCNHSGYEGIPFSRPPHVCRSEHPLPHAVHACLFGLIRGRLSGCAQRSSRERKAESG